MIDRRRHTNRRRQNLPEAYNLVFRIVPFVHEVESTDRKQRHYRHRLVLATVGVDIPVISALPKPTYIARVGDDVIPWFTIGNDLLRPVRLRNTSASLKEIFEETDLVPRRWVLHCFFADHPSAMFKVYIRPYRENHYHAERLVGAHSIRWTNLEERLETTATHYSRCRIFEDVLLAPAMSPTYRVTSTQTGIDVGIERGGLLRSPPSYHFGCHDLDLAQSMAAALGKHDVEHEDNDDGAPRIDHVGPASIHDGALATARSLAPHFLRAYSRLGPDDLGEAELLTYGALRDLHIGDSDDETATNVLEGLMNGIWPARTRYDFRPIADALYLRKALLAGRYDPPDLTKFKL